MSSSLGVQRVGRFLILAMTFVVPVLADEKAAGASPRQTNVAATAGSAPESATAAERLPAVAGPGIEEPAAAAPASAEPATSPATETAGATTDTAANSTVDAPSGTASDAASKSAAATTSAPANPNKKLYVDIYPLFAWAPFFSANFTVPPLPGGGGGQTLGGNTAFKINGALAFAFDVKYDNWLLEAEGMFAGVSAKRQSPYVNASTHVDYWDAFVGYDLGKGLYVLGGVRRITVDFKATVGNLPTFARKPRLTNPLVGAEYRIQLGHKINIQGRFDIGGFGVGSYVDVDAQFRAEWRFAKHFGMLVGYQYLYDDLHGTVTETILNQTLTHNWTYAQTFHGPILGIGIYF